MNNKERFEIAIDYLKNIKPLKEICIKYFASEDDLKKHGLENKFKIPKGHHTAVAYYLTESNKMLNSYEFSYQNGNDNYCVRFDKIYNALCNGNFVLELRYIEKANVFALCNYAIECPLFGAAKVDFIGAYIITPDKRAKLYKVESHKKLWRKIISDYGSYHKFLRIRPFLLNNSPASWNETFGKLFQFTYNLETFYECVIDWNTFLNSIEIEEPRHKNTKEQKQIDKLLKLPLKKVTKENLAFRKGTEFKKRAFIERVKDDMICIRYFQHNDFTGEIFETMRFYIDKKNTYFCQKNSLNQFIATSFDKEPISIGYFDADKMIFDKSSSFVGTIIDYYKDIIESDIEMSTAQILLNCIYCPPFEKFWKEDFKEIIYSFAKTRHYSFNIFLHEYFGNINPSASSLRKILGINEYQLTLIKQSHWNCEVLNEYQKKAKYIAGDAKYMVGAKMLPSLTNKQTDELFSILNKSYENRAYEFPECFKLLREMYSLKTAFSIANDFIKMQKRFSCSNNRRRIACIYRDYLRMVKELGMTNIYRPQFSSRSIIKMHDEVLEVYNVKKTIIENEKFAKRIEALKKFEYADSDFSVIAPKEAEDLANEGAKLHHCVKSYIRCVANGETNIVFIRKNTELEKPFFTVEITNDDTIQQVHGLQNRNADTEKGLTEFVEKWAKDKNLTLCDINKIR